MNKKQKLLIAAFAVPLLVWAPIAVAGNSAQLVGAGIRYTCQTSQPAPINTHRTWVRCSDGHQMDTDASNVDRDVTLAASTAAGGVGVYASPAPTVKGQIPAYSPSGATYYLQAPGSDGQCLQALSSSATGLTYGSCGGGGSTGNYGFSSNTMDLTGAATMSIAPTTATQLTLGASGIDTHIAGQLKLDGSGLATAAPGTNGADFSFWAGVFKTTVGANTFGGSSNTFTNGIRVPTIGTDATHQLNLPTAYTSGTIATIADVSASNIQWYSPVDASTKSTLVVVGGTQTNGIGFQMTHPCTITGARYNYPDSTSRTILFSLWLCTAANCSTNTKVASASATISTPGVHTINFGSSYSLTNTYQTFLLSYSDNASTSYWKYNNSNAVPGGSIFQSTGGLGTTTSFCTMAGPNICFQGLAYWIGTKDTAPTTGPNGEYNPIEPIFTVP